MLRVAIGILISFCCLADQNSIRLAGSAQPAADAVENIVAAVTKGIHSEREKALALHRYGMAHMLHFDGPIEERGEYVTDPMKLIAVYGYALCGNNSSAMNALYNAAGLKARKRSMPGHSVPEVWFEGKWNYIDTDMFGYVFLPDGEIASVDELTRDPDLFVKADSHPDPYYPWDRKEDMASTFRGVNPSKDYHPYAAAHLTNFSLRTGESARLFFRPKGEGRYYLTPSFRPDLGSQYKTYWLEGPVRKDSLAWTDRPPASYGNGLIEYAPDLRSQAFARENPDRSGVAVGRGGRSPELIAARGGETASMIVKVTTPWIIAGLQNDLTNFEDNTDGAVVSGLFWRTAATDENRIYISRDKGVTWTKVWENGFLGAVPFRVDLTRWAEGEYGYWVKFEWKGSAQTGLEKLRVRTWVELSPMALPRLAAGHNTFRLDTAPLRAVYTQSRWDRNQPLPDERREPGAVTFSPGAEGEIRELRVSIRARGSRGATLSASEDGGASWRKLETFARNPEHNVSHMWFNHVLRGRIDASRCRLKVEPDGGELVQVIANSLVAAPSVAPNGLRVTHIWREGEQEKSFSKLMPANAEHVEYEIEAAPGLINEEVRLEGIAQ